ncbi:MAG: outer membrane beta-barrel protein [Ahrensia sp.]
MTNFKRVSMAVIALSLAMPVAHAADLDPIFADDANKLRPAELGSGWYLRGDISYTFDREQEGGFEYTPDVGVPTRNFDLSDSAGFGVGFGKKINELLRVDVTADRIAGSSEEYYGTRGFSGTRTFTYDYLDAGSIVQGEASVRFDRYGNMIGNSCNGPNQATCAAAAAINSNAIGGHENIDLSYSVYNVMANGYIDLPKQGKFGAYVGGGIGAARPVVSLNHTVTCAPDDASSCSFPGGGVGETVEDFELVNDEYSKWLVSYSAAAGVTYDLTNNIALDLGYKYTKVNDMESVLDGSNVSSTLLEGLDTSHSVRLGVRVSTW